MYCPYQKSNLDSAVFDTLLTCQNHISKETNICIEDFQFYSDQRGKFFKQIQRLKFPSIGFFLHPCYISSQLLLSTLADGNAQLGRLRNNYSAIFVSAVRWLTRNNSVSNFFKEKTTWGRGHLAPLFLSLSLVIPRHSASCLTMKPSVCVMHVVSALVLTCYDLTYSKVNCSVYVCKSSHEYDPVVQSATCKPFLEHGITQPFLCSTYWKTPRHGWPSLVCFCNVKNSTQVSKFLSVKDNAVLAQF